MTTQAQPVALCLRCIEPPPATHDDRPTEFGLQDKKQTLHLGKRLPDGSLQFDFEVTASSGAGSGAIKFRGPFVHGTAGAPFVYLSYREAQAGSPWIRRWKISLSTITDALVREAIAGDKPIHGAISGKGGASVPLLGDGWTVGVG